MSDGDSRSMPRLVLVGDVATETADPARIFDRIAPYFRQSAIAFCNCEWPLTDRGEPWPGKAGRVVRSAPDLVRAYRLAGFDVVSLANNHVMNYGAAGLAQTIEMLDGAGIVHCGAGCDQAAAHRPAILDWQGRRFAFLAYSSVFTAGMEAGPDKPGMAVIKIETSYHIPKRLHEMPGSPLSIETSAEPAHVERLVADIERARREADAVIVSMHWGVSMGHQHLVPYQIELGHRAIDAGADLVVGHHPHTLQPVELYKGRLIAYCLAHCGFDMQSKHYSEDAIAVELPIVEKGLGRPILRAVGDSIARPVLLDAEQGRRTMEWLERLSLQFGTILSPQDAGFAVASR
jgi:poly-gamma-glutamate capsule biosynthesis protein CapA/YwtB (metallophosphatase superfamily)